MSRNALARIVDHLPAAGLAALLGAILLGGCQQDSPADAGNATKQADGGKATPVAAAFTPKAQGPQIEFETTTHDFGVISDTEKHRTRFAFRNVGSERLVIKDVKAACGCTVPTLNRYEFEPGEGTELDIVFDPKGKSDVTEKFITVISNSVSDPNLRLHITSNIKSLLAFERMHNMGTIKLGEGRQEVVPLRYFDPDLEFVEVTVNNPSVTARIVESGVVDSTGDDEMVYRAGLEITVSPGTPWGLLYATRVNMKVRGRPRLDAPPVDYSYDMYLLGSVYGDLAARTGIISLGNVSPGQQFNGSVELARASQKPFNISAATITDTSMPGLTARAEPIGPYS